MSERYEFAGPTVTPADEGEAARYIDKLRKRESKFFSGALEKTPGEENAIILADELLKREFRDLGITERVPDIRLGRFHVMSKQWFDENEGKNTWGSYSVIGDQAVLCRERARTPVNMYKVIFHEAIHAASKQKHWVQGHSESNPIAPKNYRVGYQVINWSNPEELHEHLRGFNEGVVEMTTQSLFSEHAQEIKVRLGITKSQVEEAGFAYSESREVIREIIQTLAAVQEKSEEEVWKKIRKGQFSGEMMYLRDIEYTYGKGALRVLDALDVRSDDSRTDAEKKFLRDRNEKILEYFKSGDQPGVKKKAIRLALAREILGEEDYKKYCTEE